MPDPIEEAIRSAAETMGLDDDFDGIDLVAGDDDDAESDDSQSDEDEGSVEEGDESEGDEESEDEQDDDGDEENDDAAATAKTYFRIDLSDVPAETRETILSELKDKDRYITRQQQEKSALQKEVEELRQIVTDALGTNDADDAPEMPSDQEIIAKITEEFGLDPEDPFYEIQVKAALPGVKASLAAQAKTAAMQEELEILRFQNEYTSKLATLEADNGRLPVSHEVFISWAADNEFGPEPEDAYFAFMKRANEVLGNKAPDPKPASKKDKAKQEARRAAKKAAGTGARKPAGATKQVPKGADGFDAAAKAALEKLGISS